ARLADPESTEEIQPTIVEEKRTFGSRYAADEYFYNCFKESGLTDIERDRGMWAWLSLFYFDELCPVNKKGQRKPGERARWIPDYSWRKYYRHPLLQPYRIYSSHHNSPESIQFLLEKPLSVLGDFAEQVFSRQEIVTNPFLLKAVETLYFDKASGREKKGATSYLKFNGKSRGREGTLRRLLDVLEQY